MNVEFLTGPLVASLVLATVMVSLMPGPSMMLVISLGAQRGLVAGLKAALGVVVADAVLLAICFSGLIPLMLIWPGTLLLLKWLGVGYLLYLALGQWRGRHRKQEIHMTGNGFAQALGVTLLNPKIILFLLAFFPQFLQSGVGTGHQLLVLGPIFLLTVGAVLSGYALLGVLLLGRINQYLLNSGSALALFGFSVATALS